MQSIQVFSTMFILKYDVEYDVYIVSIYIYIYIYIYTISLCSVKTEHGAPPPPFQNIWIILCIDTQNLQHHCIS